jgi:hypothetical protein
MKSGGQTFRVRFAALMLGGLIAAVGPAFAGGKTQTFTGEVSDAMCGAKHMMDGTAADCARACVSKGSKYALVVGGKLYTLDSSDKDTLAQFDKLAGEQAKVSGTVEGDTITVTAVTAAK